MLVATTEEVYDDYGNGAPSDEAIRRFIKDRFYAANAEFVLLVGDANSDHRGLLLTPPAGSTQLASAPDYVPTHLITRLEDEAPNKETAAERQLVRDGRAAHSDPYPDLYIGRLPASSAAEARTMVDKILRFENYDGDEAWRKTRAAGRRRRVQVRRVDPGQPLLRRRARLYVGLRQRRDDRANGRGGRRHRQVLPQAMRGCRPAREALRSARRAAPPPRPRSPSPAPTAPRRWSRS